jgi:rubrerythrin
MMCPNCGTWMTRIVSVEASIEGTDEGRPAEGEQPKVKLENESQDESWTCEECGYLEER